MANWEPARPPVPKGTPSPAGHCRPAMAPIAVILLAALLLASPSWARRPKPSKSPIDNISAQEQFDPARVSGGRGCLVRWVL